MPDDFGKYNIDHDHSSSGKKITSTVNVTDKHDSVVFVRCTHHSRQTQLRDVMSVRLFGVVV